MVSDIIIVGAGVVGCALARVLSRYQAGVTVLEKAPDVAEGASKANSGIVHAGFDAHPGTLKARLNVEGAQMYPELCRELGVPYSQPGALVLGFSDEDRATLENLVRQGEANGVPGVRLVEREEILQMEPQTNPAVVCALYAPTSGLTSPYEMTFALADHAALNGVRFERDTEVRSVCATEEGWKVETNRGEYTAKVLVNCAVNPLSAVLGMPVPRILRHPDGCAMAQQIAREVAALALKKGISGVDAEQFISKTLPALAAGPENYSSMANDLLFAKRKTEIDQMNGAVVGYAEQLGIELPVCSLMTRLIHLLEDCENAHKAKI